jgi:transcriptional regulator with XRE-family HTH domain
LAAQGRDWLSRTLRDLREATGQSGVKAAQSAGLSQSRISRIESGVFLPTEEEIGRLCDLYHASPATRRRLLQVARDLRAEIAPARVVLQRGAWRLQRRIASIEENAAEICAFTASIVPGLLQTPEYARVVFADGGDIAGEELDKAVASRVARGAILDGPGRSLNVIMAEGALRWQAGNAHVMAAQLDHLVKLNQRPQLRIGVVPWTRPAHVFALHGFSVYDHRVVIVGTRTGTSFITDAQDVAEYVRLFSELDAMAVFGSSASRVIREIAAGYRSLA